MGDTARNVKETVQQAHESTWMDHVARAGLLAFGVVHLLLAWVALQLAFGGRSERNDQEASNTGAFAELAQQSFGEIALGAVALGLVLLVCWQVAESAFGSPGAQGSDRWVERGKCAGRAVIYGAMAASAWQVLLGAGSSSSGPSMTARAMSWPAGQWLVVLVGLGVVVAGAVIAWRGWSEKFLEELDHSGRTSDAHTAYRWFGKLGHLAKGAALAVVGVLVAHAGWTHDGSEDKGMDDALRTVLVQPFGPWLLALVALGLACFGLFSFARARHLNR